MGTLTYDYKNSTAVLGPLATVAEPHTYDLCEFHVSHLTVPRGWEVVRLQINYDDVPPSEDDLMALVEAVREAADQSSGSASSSADISGGFSHFSTDSQTFEANGRTTSRDHLKVVAGEVDEPKAPTNKPPEAGPF